ALQGVELTGTNRSCGLVVLLFQLLHRIEEARVERGIRRPSATPSCLRICEMVSGGYIGGDPPVPIPNTEVKPSRADGTARFPCGRVGRCRNFSSRASSARIRMTPRRASKAPRGVAFCAAGVFEARAGYPAHGVGRGSRRR